MPASNWDNILLDTGAVPLPLDDGRFRQWMARQRVFVSSPMDAELTSYRQAIRAHLEQVGPGVAVMWETISPQDIRPDRAYLDGVDRSTLFVLVLGSRYGVADDSGYSPTHKESNRGKERYLHRLLFTLPVDKTDRDGKLNDWLGSMYNEVSGNVVVTPQDLVSQLDSKLRNFAARAERNWIKLGRCVFPGRVEITATSQGGRSFLIIARAQDHRVRRELQSLGDPMQRGGEMRLTWPNESYPVVLERVQQKSEYVGEADIEIACRMPQNWYGQPGGGQWNMTVNGVGPDELTRHWIQHAIFGQPVPGGDMHYAMAFGAARPDGQTLPQVLAQAGATGWQAEGLVRLYAVEELAHSRGGHFSYLNVGPATATGISIDGEFYVENYGQQSSPMRVSGVVPLGR